MFGPHLLIDGSKCDTAKLADRLGIERILTDYPRAIGMTRIGGPYMFEYQAPDPAYSGVSGLVVIAESHIAIHTFPALDYFTMDIFSCKNFDHEVAIDYIREALGVREMDRMLIQRGLSFRGPHHGAQGATDDLIAAAAVRHAGLPGITTGSIPTDDPLYPQPDAGRMLWPAYGVTPDLGTYQPDALTSARGGAIITAANAAAAGEQARPGLSPIQPMQLNPTASTSGIIDRMQAMGGQGRQLGKALAQWETFARTPSAPVVLALGPHVVAAGMSDVIADLIQRGHVAGIIIEDDGLLADAYASLGYRHYVDVEADTETPVRAAEEWQAACVQFAAMLQLDDAPLTSHRIAAQLGDKLATTAPRPGILTAAAQRHLPVIAVGAHGLDELGVIIDDSAADVATLRVLLTRPHAGLIAFGTTANVSELITATGAVVNVIAIDAAPFAGPTIVCRLDATIALPLLATGIVQRVPQRVTVNASDAAPPARDERDSVLATR